MRSIFSVDEVGRLEGIGRRTVYRRIESNQYVVAKMPREHLGARKKYGIPVHCLTEEGQQRAVREQPELAKVLKLTV